MQTPGRRLTSSAPLPPPPTPSHPLAARRATTCAPTWPPPTSAACPCWRASPWMPCPGVGRARSRSVPGSQRALPPASLIQLVAPSMAHPPPTWAAAHRSPYPGDSDVYNAIRKRVRKEVFKGEEVGARARAAGGNQPPPRAPGTPRGAGREARLQQPCPSACPSPTATAMPLCLPLPINAPSSTAWSIALQPAPRLQADMRLVTRCCCAAGVGAGQGRAPQRQPRRSYGRPGLCPGCLPAVCSLSQHSDGSPAG
jgi:hypothetical protein